MKKNTLILEIDQQHNRIVDGLASGKDMKEEINELIAIVDAGVSSLHTIFAKIGEMTWAK